MLRHPYKNTQLEDPCTELLQSVLSSGIIIFRLKQSSELVYDPGMLSSWEIPLMETGLKNFRCCLGDHRFTACAFDWLQRACLAWQSDFGVTRWAEHSWRPPKTLLWVIWDSSPVPATEICPLVLICEEGKSWMKSGMLGDAEGAKGRVAKQGMRSGVLLILLLDQHPQYLVYKVLFLLDSGSKDRV